MHKHNQKKASGAAIFWSWFLIFTTCIVAMIPVVGFVSWIVGLAALAIVTVLAIVIIGEGRTSAGVFILLSAYIAAPLFILVAPVASFAMFMNKLETVKVPGVELIEEAVTDQRIRTEVGE